MPCALVLWLALSLGEGLDPRGAAIASIGGALLLAAGVRSSARGAGCAVVAAFALCGLGRGAACRNRIDVEERLANAASSPGWMRVRVVEPARWESGSAMLVAATCARPAERGVPEGLRLRLRLPPGEKCDWGDRLEVLAEIESVPRRRNPGGYDGRAAARAAGIAAQGRVFAIRWLEPGLAGWPRATVSRWRRALEARLRRGLSEAAYEITSPLLFGDRSGIGAVLDARFRAAGLTHLLALSGLHVTWLAGVVRAAAASLGFGVRGRAVAGLLSALLYGGLAGPLPSLMRAVADEAISAVARWRFLALDRVQALGLSAIAILIVRPGWADDVGFRLSFAATLGLVTRGAAWGRRTTHWIVPMRELARIALPTASAQLATLPILLATFSGVSAVGLLTNLLAVPLSGLLLTSAWVGALLDCLAPGVGRPWLSACELLSGALRATAEIGAGLPGAWWAARGEPGLVALSMCGAMLAAWACSERRCLDDEAREPSPARGAATLVGMTMLASCLLCASLARPLVPPVGRFWVVALDVGQGDATALGFSRGWWLVDAGPAVMTWDAGTGVVVPFFRWAGVSRLEALVLTHDDRDHTGGAPAILRSIDVEKLWVPAPRSGLPGPGARFGGAAVARGDSLRADPRIVVVWPPTARDTLRLRHDNQASIVLEVGTGQGRALLPADVDSLIETRLEIAREPGLFKVGHHGSASSSGAGFLEAVRPREAFVSAGRRNRFGHPAPAVLERFQRLGVRVHRTDREGALWFEVGPNGVLRVDWRRGAPLGDVVSTPTPPPPRR